MIRRSFAFSFARQYGTEALRGLSLVVLARLLAPEDFGVFAAAVAVFSLGQVLAQFGITSYIVQELDLTPQLRRAALGVVLVSGALVTSCFIAAVVLLPETWLPPAMREVFVLLTVCAALVPFEAVLNGALQRSLHFGRTSIIDLSATSINVGTAIALALLDYGHMSLAWAYLAGKVSVILLSCCFVGSECWLRPTLVGADRVLRFSSKRMLLTLLFKGGDSAIPLTASAFHGFLGAGLINRAHRVVGLLVEGPVESAKPVVLAALSQMRRQNRSLQDAYLRYKVPFLTGLAWPACGFVLLFSEAIVMLLLGPGWDQAVVLVQLLCVAGIIRANFLMSTQFYAALDLLGTFLRRQLVMQIAKLAMITLGALHSLEALALALVCHSLLGAVVSHGPLKRALGYRTQDLVRELLRSGLVTTVAIGAALACALLWRWPSADDLVPLAGAAAVAGLAWLAAIFTFRHPIAQEIMVIAPRLLGRVRGVAERPSVG